MMELLNLLLQMIVLPDNTDKIINNYLENNSIPDNNIEIKYTLSFRKYGDDV